LVVAVQGFLENTFSTVDMNTCITQAEKRIYNVVQIPALRKSVTGTMTATNQYLACPTDFLSSYSMAVIAPVTGAYTYLINKDVSFIREAYSVPAATGTPKYYALFGPRSDQPTELGFIVGPTPDVSYAVELHYFFYPESITTAASGTTWLGDNFDPVLLYGTLVEAYTFMKGEADLLAMYNTKFSEALSQLKRLGDGLEKQDAYRSGQPRIQVT
jgi:hypothetical protein